MKKWDTPIELIEFEKTLNKIDKQIDKESRKTKKNSKQLLQRGIINWDFEWKLERQKYLNKIFHKNKKIKIKIWK